MHSLSNLSLIEDLYARYLKDPKSVDASWRYFFEGVDFSGFKTSSGKDPACRILGLIQAYRRYGHLEALFNPLDTSSRVAKELELSAFQISSDEIFPTFGLCDAPEASAQEIVAALRRIYCSRIGFEYMDLGIPGLEAWMQSRIESKEWISFTEEEKGSILNRLNASEIFETFLHTKYPGQTRFSLEGLETLIPILSDLIEQASHCGIDGLTLGMAHRGRLNVLTNILEKQVHVLFKEFEDTISYLEEESGDVKYHKGFSSDLKVKDKTIHVHLAPNSSSLESVDGIVLGQTKAKQVAGKKWGAILLHGDAALAGQGVIYETLQMSGVDGFATGGTIHIAMNNQIGYTTLPQEGRSTRYCTDIAKAFSCPVFHVNAEDPESCIFAARVALAFRLEFQRDVFIDLNGYRKYGHNEGDEPSFTQPVQYTLLKDKKTIRKIYLEQLLQEGSLVHKMAESLERQFKEKLKEAFEVGKTEESIDLQHRFGASWKEFAQPSSETLFAPFSTKVEEKKLQEILALYTTVPEGFHLHPKLEKWLQDRRLQIKKDPKIPSIDWGTAECLCFGSILLQGASIRLSGQDAKRGTFSHRHAVWFDQQKGAPYTPFSRFNSRFDVYNTILSEYGVLAFEFGYSWASQNTLVMWEAQYGDFDIGAQIVIDHYIVCAEQKWTRYSALVLLLPHAYEGAGPEHSSARLERFLQLAANNNMQVVYPTTPSQMFHLLRRQAFRQIKKPLIVLTPKSLLRLPSCTSPLSDFTEGEFLEFIDDPAALSTCKKLFLCSGKIYYDLLAIREEILDAAVIRIEQIYPFHEDKFKSILSKYKNIQVCCYVQEEPENMGAWEFLHPVIASYLPNGMAIQYIGRPRSAFTATGSRKQHMKEQASILERVKRI